MSYYVYIVRCSDQTLYCGSTNDVYARLKKHNSPHDGAKYTRSRRPVKLVYAKKYHSKNVAMRREYAVKQLTRKEKQELIKLNPIVLKKS